MKVLLIIMLICFYSCGPGMQVKNVKAYSGPSTLKVQKIFVLSLTPKERLRNSFENRLRKSLKRENIEVFSAGSVTSPDFYDNSTTKKALEKLEDSLLSRGVEIVLLAKIIRVDDHKNIRQSLAGFSGSYRSFKSDYYNNQDLLLESEESSDKIYHTYTSLYKLPQNGHKEVIWEGEIVIKKKLKLKKATKNYVSILISEWKKRNIL